MKIIGESKDGFIIEASRGEIANLLGFYSEYSSGYERPKVGDEIEVSKMFSKLYHLEKNKHSIDSIVKTIRGLADVLEPLGPVVKNLVDENDEEE
ncbi:MULTISPECIES: hypothetical protein [Bacillales]|jgi:hypothetical protein|uniref:hypothetical protein n=1 Tax=Bacillales TaxID=1385 RepID=UPI0005D12ABF|nr:MULTISPECIES: hypothetical protein [Bacillaceae]